MGNSIEKEGNTDFEDESLETPISQREKEAEKPAKRPKSKEEAEVIDLQKRREEIIEQRKKPDLVTAETQSDKAGETLQKSAEEEEMALEKELLIEQLEKSGLQLSEEEIQSLYEAVPDLASGISPEFSEYVQGMMPRIENVLTETEKFKKEGNEYKAVEKLSDFLGSEMDQVEKIKDENTRIQLLSFIGSTIDIEKVVEDMKKQTTVDGATELIKIVPVVGPGIDLAEAARGRSSAGKKLSGGQRVKRAALGTTFMIMDIAGLVTAGSTTAVRAGITAAKAGKGIKDVAQVASGAYKTAKAAEKVSKTASLAAKGARIGKSVTRFAAISRKTTKLRRVSKTIFKVGKLIQKYPRLTYVIAKTMKLRSGYKSVVRKTALAGKVVKTRRGVAKVSHSASSQGLSKAA